MRTTALVAVALLLVAGCSADDDPGEPERPDEGSATVGTSAPDEQLTVVGDTFPFAAAASTSRALFDEATVAVVAQDGDRAGELLGASAAVGLGVPLLLQQPGAAGSALGEELDRLGTDTVLAVGEVPVEVPGVEVVAVAADPGAVEGATGLDLGDAEEVAEDGAVAAVAALDPERPAALVPDGGPTGGGGGDGRLPEVDRAEPLSDTLVVATAGPESVAAVATARAAGARVQVVEDADPRASTDLVELLAEEQPAAVVAVGAPLGLEDGLDWKLASAATGEQLPGGGQLLFPGRMMVALYGSPGTGALGLLGEQDLDGAITRAREYAGAYEPLVDVPVVPTFEIIATVASSSAGADGDYSSEVDIEVLRPWVEAAGEAGVYVVLDLQPGRTDFVTQAERYRSLLELPHVGLALDPEWRLGPNEVHLTQIGSVDVEEVNRVVTWLADLTRENALPQKLLVLHQFRLDMLPGRERLDLSRDELAVLIHADGQGSQGDKQATWRALRAASPPVWWGWKNFIDEDLPMLTPEQTVAQVDPVPQLVSYQ
ncbi:hypothetical protein [Blastococcus sp. TF02A-26]|uniref:hypothetical protein n=1 Tax=Blastococcus sp. TF02A-26 TaxID=2250577 RepID=UPI000DE866DF|nr:hypothetical protein [Blastococcus sp. TF02A-26]RBY81823.1 hypothetical protein DQ240_20100 [Blastococcus sp. TF02A-26]